MAVTIKPLALGKNRYIPTLIRSTLTAIGIAFLLTALLLYLFDITSLTRLELLILAFTLPAIITPLVNWQHAQRSVIIETMQEELREVSRHDASTGLFTKRAFLELAQKELMLASRHSYPVALACLGLDKFDELKQTYKRILTDHALYSCGNFLKTNLRETDTLARYAEDSFIILMPHTTPQQAQEVILRLQSQLKQTPVRLDHQDITLSLSAGISFAAPHYNLEKLSEYAEKALNRAKSQGDNELES